MKLFLTSDCHFGHDNIRKYCNRPFKTVEEMNARIIKNWNERVKPEDTVIHIGDFCFKNTPGGKPGEGMINRADFYRKRLNGNIVFVKGNHDNNNSCKTKIISLVIDYANQQINCVHDPVHYNSYYELNLVGHVHGLWKIKREGKCILFNVGVDVNNFRPVFIEEILRYVSRFKRGEISEV